MKHADTPTPADLIALLQQPRRPRTAGLQPLIPAAHHDEAITALTTSAIGHDDPQRAADAAAIALRWGTALIGIHTTTTPTPATAVYCGAVRWAGYLAGHVIARYFDTHPDTTGDTTLQDHITTLTNQLGTDPTPTGDQALMPTGLRLRRHLTSCRYTRPELDALTAFSRIGSVHDQHRAATIGHVAWEIVSLGHRGHLPLIRQTLGSAPLPS